MNFSIKDFFSKCKQIRRKLRIWSHLLKESRVENFRLFVVIKMVCCLPIISIYSIKHYDFLSRYYSQFISLVDWKLKQVLTNYHSSITSPKHRKCLDPLNPQIHKQPNWVYLLPHCGYWFSLTSGFQSHYPLIHTHRHPSRFSRKFFALTKKICNVTRFTDICWPRSKQGSYTIV